MDFLLGAFLSKNPKSKYRNLHCISKDWDINLCPNANEIINWGNGREWQIRTNQFSERIVTDDHICSKNKREIWLLGDSMAMGYNLPEKDTLAFLLQKKTDFFVRILAVDAVGTKAIQRILQNALVRYKTDCNPVQIYWIWNPSDFLDDEREIHLAGWKKIFFLIHFQLSKYSYLYSFFLNQRDPNKYTSKEEKPKLFDKDHITYRNLAETIDWKKNMNLPLTFIFFWGMDKKGKADTTDPNYDAFVSFLNDKKEDYIDLRPLLQRENQSNLYIPGDGHPANGLNQLFANSIQNHLKMLAAEMLVF